MPVLMSQKVSLNESIQRRCQVGVQIMILKKCKISIPFQSILNGMV
jgi:hypothetical protein